MSSRLQLESACSRVRSSARTGVSAPPASGDASVHQVLRNSTLNLTVQGIHAAFYVLVFATLARGLGQSLLGEYYLLFALVMMMQLVLEAGTTTLLTRRIARAPEAWRETVAEGANLCWVVVLASLGVFLALGLVWAWCRGDPSVLAHCVLAGVACAGLQVQRFCAAVFRAFDLFGYENLARVIQGGIYVTLVVALVLLGRGTLDAILASLAGSYLVGALVLLDRLGRRWSFAAWRWRWPHLKQWLAESVPLGLGDMMRGQTWQLDTVLLGLLQPAAVVGIYSAAYRPLSLLTWLPVAALPALFPSLVRLASSSPEALRRAFANSMRLLWVLGLPLAVTVGVCAEPLILLLAGRDYLEAALPMRLLIWKTTLAFLSLQFRFVFTAVGRQHLFGRLVVCVLVGEAVIELALIPWWGYFGACAGCVLGEVAFTAAGLAMCYYLGIGSAPWGALARALLAAGVMAAGLWFARGLPWPLLALAVACGTVGYFALCLLLGALRWSEVYRFCQALTSTPPAAEPVRAG